MRTTLLAALMLAVGCSGSESQDAPGAPPTAGGTAAGQPPAAATRSVDEDERCAPAQPARFEVVDGGRSGPIALVREGARTLAIVADADERALHVVDVATRTQIALTPLEAEPTQVLALDDGRVAITYRYEDRVEVREPTADWRLEVRCAAEVVGEPIGMAPRGDELLVTAGYGAALARLDAGDLTEIGRTPLPREPRAVAVSGDRVFVSHMVGGILSQVDLPRGTSTRISLDVPHGPSFEQDDERHGNQGFALALAHRQDGSTRLFAPGVSVSTGSRAEPISTGYGSITPDSPRPVVPFVAVVDGEAGRMLTRRAGTARSPIARGCMLPREATVRGDRLYVSCLGVDAVVELDARTANPAMLELRRFAVPSGPTGLRVDADGERLVVWSQFAKELATVDLAAGAVARATLARRDEALVSPELARGRALFHSTVDARISGDHRACASCHPDGRDDGLVWSSPDGPRQTKHIAGTVVDAAPFGWFGEHATLREHLRVTMQNLGGSGLEIDVPGAEDDLQALMAYVRSLPVPRAHRVEAELAARGRVIFTSEEQGCEGCHRAGGTDGLAYDVGSGSTAERSARFDTPSLRRIAGSPPYFHDGRFPTLAALLRARDVRMGHPADLSDDDRAALETYLKTL